MSSSQAEQVREILALFSEGRVDEAIARLPADAELDGSRSNAMRAVVRGPADITRAFHAIREAFEEQQWEPEEIVQLAPDRVLAVNRMRARGRESGVEVSARGAQLWEFRDDRPRRVELHQGREEAMRSFRAERMARARLYFVCDARPGGEDPRPLLDAAIRGGAGIVQLRDKELGDDELVAAAAPFRRAADEGGALFILNDRPDLVADCAGDGVHVGQDDTPVADARRAAGPDALVGLSTHSEEQVAAACEAEGDARPDQISVGPVFRTPTKEGRPATGLGLVEYAAGEATIPWFAIGGIDLETIDEVTAAGAKRAVVVRAIRDATDPEAAARRLSKALTAAAGEREPAHG